MRILVIGGSGLIGSRLVTLLRTAGHEVVPASPASGVDTISGAGLAEAMSGTDVVVDVSNSPAWEDDAVLEFFTTSTRNQLAAELAAGVKHHVAISIVGASKLADSGYMRAKVAQEALIESGGVPYTVLLSTQFFEFIAGIADASVVDGDVRLPEAPFQPVAADDVVAVLAGLVTGRPVNGRVEIAGPERSTLADMAARVLAAKGDERKVVADPSRGYFGARVGEGELVPADHPDVVGNIALDQWLPTDG